MAFQYWRQCEMPEPKRTKFLALGNAYHGDTIGGITVGGLARFRDLFEPLLFEVVRTPSPDPRKLPEEVPRDTAASYYLDQLDATLAAIPLS